MESNTKFYITSNRILDAEIIADVQYHATGEPIPSQYHRLGVDGEQLPPESRKMSELHLYFKDSEKDSIALFGDEADTAWKNYRRAVNINLEAWDNA
jgi:hypothetical protein